MKCPKCNGRGTVGYFHIDHFVDIECDRCHGSGEVSEVEMTNEEWLCDYFNNEFRAMPTEKKAKVISDFILRLEELNCNKLAWMKWLKEKHTIKE